VCMLGYMDDMWLMGPRWDDVKASHARCVEFCPALNWKLVGKKCQFFMVDATTGNVEFKKAVMKETFERLESDEQFGSRHPALLKVYKILKATGVIALLGLIPPSLCTPMTFTMTLKTSGS